MKDFVNKYGSVQLQNEPILSVHVSFKFSLFHSSDEDEPRCFLSCLAMVKIIHNVQHEYLHETFVNFNFKSTLKTLKK